jgi:hypothetical protein
MKQPMASCFSHCLDLKQSCVPDYEQLDTNNFFFVQAIRSRPAR